MKIQVQNGEELRRVAAEIVLNVTPRNVATTIALSGELGAGKTTFVQEIARALGVSETVSSPTFVIEKIYPIRDAARSNGVGGPRRGAGPNPGGRNAGPLKNGGKGAYHPVWGEKRGRKKRENRPGR